MESNLEALTLNTVDFLNTEYRPADSSDHFSHMVRPGIIQVNQSGQLIDLHGVAREDQNSTELTEEQKRVLDVLVHQAPWKYLKESVYPYLIKGQGPHDKLPTLPFYGDIRIAYVMELSGILVTLTKDNAADWMAEAPEIGVQDPEDEYADTIAAKSEGDFHSSLWKIHELALNNLANLIDVKNFNVYPGEKNNHGTPPWIDVRAPKHPSLAASLILVADDNQVQEDLMDNHFWEDDFAQCRFVIPRQDVLVILPPISESEPQDYGTRQADHLQILSENCRTFPMFTHRRFVVERPRTIKNAASSKTPFIPRGAMIVPEGGALFPEPGSPQMVGIVKDVCHAFFGAADVIPEDHGKVTSTRTRFFFNQRGGRV